MIIDNLQHKHHLLSLLKSHDPITYDHSIRVANLMKLFGAYLDIKEEDTLRELYELGLYHDIGKLQLERNILLKRGKLTTDEFNKIKNHPAYSFEILNDKGYSNEFMRGILYHHENYDGTGYPYNLKYDEIPLYANLLRIVDSYDAMTNNRSYQKAYLSSYALNELMSLKGKMYHPTYMDEFYQMKTSHYDNVSNYE